LLLNRIIWLKQNYIDTEDEHQEFNVVGKMINLKENSFEI
jgi:hypothetical protein